MNNQLKRAISYYNKAFPNKEVANNVMSVIADVMTGRYPNATELTPFWTIGDVKKCSGWHADPRMLYEIVSSFQGRALRAMAIRAGVNFPKLPIEEVIEFVRSTDEQTKQVVQMLIPRTKRIYGNVSGMSDADWNALCAMTNGAVK